MKIPSTALLGIFSLLAATLSFSGCNPPSASWDGNISVEAAYTMAEGNQGNPNFVIIDVRTPAEFSEGHIANSINIDVENAGFEKTINGFDKDKTYLVYCHSGNRSLKAAKTMIDMGFKTVYNMLAGITAWQAAGYPVVK
jgi:rhodanese-related sulfurtransferase